MNNFKSFNLNRLSPKTNAIIAFIITITVFIYWISSKFDGNITGFFRIGSVLPLSPYLNPERVKIYIDELGYDGQQFLSLSLDPFLHNPETIQSLDHPLYRYRRIFYPLLSYFLGFGQPQVIPYVMIAINFISIILLVFLVSKFWQKYPMAWLGLAVLLIPGVWISFSLTTADLLSSLLLIASFYFYSQNKPIVTSIFLAVACLTRETLILMFAAMFLTSIQPKKWHITKQLAWAWLPVFVWNLYVLNLNLPGMTGVQANFGYPFVGIFNKLLSFYNNGFNLKNLLEIYLFSTLLFSWLLTFLITYHNRRPSLNKLLYNSNLLYGCLLAISSMSILSYYLDYSRVFMDIYFLALLSCVLTANSDTSNIVQKENSLLKFTQNYPTMSKLKYFLISTWSLPTLAFIIFQS